MRDASIEATLDFSARPWRDSSAMDSTSIELPGSQVAAVEVEGETVRIRFEPAYLVKSMTGSVERTRWWQNGALVFEDASLDDSGPLPALPARCDGGDVSENVYTYRDMVPVPLASRGRASCVLRVGGGAIRVDAGAVRLEMVGVPKYIEHLRPS
jgi:hypothetical protein